LQFIFEGNVLDTDTRELRRGSEPVAVEPQVLDLLIYLVENRERVVSRDDLMDSVWRGRPVSESSLSSRIHAARRAIGDSGKDQKLIRTVSRRGLRFVGSLQSASDLASTNAGTSSSDRNLFEDTKTAAHPAFVPLDRAVIAVLPFTNMSGPEQEYLSDGIAEDLITALSKLGWFLIIAHSSSFTYKGKAVHIKQVGDELGARYVVEGSVRRSGDRIRITAQLNEVASGSHVWADRYDREAVNIFSVHDEIVQAIVSAIEPHLLAAENVRTRSKPPSSMDAWELVMRALSHYNRLTPQDHRAVRDYLEQAISLDPDYCQALAVLSSSYTFSAHMGWVEASAVVPLAENAALAAVRIDAYDAWAHHALGATYLISSQFDEAISELELALMLNPSFSHAQNYYATALAFSGRWRDAIGAVGRALRLSPRDPLLALNYGSASLAHYFGGNYEEAIRQAQTAIRLRADYASAYRVLVAAAGMSGQAGMAASALQELRRAQPNISCDWIATHVPIKLDSDRLRYIEGFRRAGLE